MINNLLEMENTHANPLYFHDNPSPFVTIRGDPMGQESWPLSSFGYTDLFHARDPEEEDGACVMTAEEEVLLQTLQNKKNRSRPGRSLPILSLATSRVRPHDDPTLYIRATGPQAQKARSAKSRPTMRQ